VDDETLDVLAQDRPEIARAVRAREVRAQALRRLPVRLTVFGDRFRARRDLTQLRTNEP